MIGRLVDLHSLTPRPVDAAHLFEAGDVESATEWMTQQRCDITREVNARGWILIRGLALAGAAEFRACINALRLLMATEYGDLPFAAGNIEGVFAVTPFPPEHAILFHNEGAHTPRPPRHICFHCEAPSATGGETPLSNGARVFHALPRSIARRLEEHGLIYRRCFVEHLDVPWQTYFGTSDPAVVQDRCRAQGITVTWDSHGRLWTETSAPAIIRHARTGERVFFNQILLHHPSCLDPEVRAAFRFILPDGATPRDVRLGDGAAIPDQWVEAILDAHIGHAHSFTWQRGDVVIADNYVVAHARRPYSGLRRHHVMLSGIDETFQPHGGLS